jgi:asparagine synthase (glutamine-hydrolysing)
MCGIAGYASLLNNVNYEKLKTMTNVLNHRGPDSNGIWISDSKHIGLAHTRLSILDLSKLGNQPMISSSGRFILTFNGEIYNHLELRKEIFNIKPDYIFKSTSDTETILSYIEEFGVINTLKSLTGMFAMIIYDIQNDELILSRDRIGEKPLYYGFINDNFIFSSELKVIINGYKPFLKIDIESLFSFLKLSYIQGPKTIYQNIYKLEPGCFLSIKIKNNIFDYNIKTFWNLADIITNCKKNLFKGTIKDAIKEYDYLLSRSINQQMISDVPLGAFLSGGTDSSLVVAIMQSLTEKKINTFTVGFKDKYYNEAEYALKISKHLGTNHHEIYIDEKDILNIIPSIATIFDEPFADSSQLPTFIVSNFAKKHVTVSLSGDGGDEIFCGYNRYLQAKRISKIPKTLTRPLVNAFSMFSEDKINFIYKSFEKILPNSIKSSNPKLHLEKIKSILELNTNWDIYQRLIRTDKNYANSLLQNFQDYNYINEIENDFNELNNDFDFVDRMVYTDTKNYLPDDILCKIDRAAMAVSLETRVPFLDHKLIEFAWSLPSNFKIRNGTTKYISKLLLENYLPTEMIYRPKMGFGIPLNKWLKNDLRLWAESILFSEKSLACDLLNHELIKDLWSQHLEEKNDNSSILWNIIIFLQWNQIYN